MKISAEDCAKRLLENDNILLLCHRDPDGDTYGSAVALCDTLVTMGKAATVQCISPYPKNLDFLHRPMAEITPDFVVTIDTAAVTMLGDGAERERHINLCIDHHPSNPLYADETFLVPYAATGEAVIEVIKAMGRTISPYAATALLTALSSDTGGFRYSNTSAQTLRYAAELFDAGADVSTVRERLFESKSRAQVGVESQALSSALYFKDNRIAVIIITLELLREFGADESELEGLASIPSSIGGVDVGITIKEREDGSVRVSVRTSAAADAGEICKAFAGGGHIRASGCRIRGTVAEAVEKLVAEASKQLS